MSTALKAIQQTLKENSSRANKAFFEKMVPGDQKNYGVKTPVLNELVKKYKEGSFELVGELWRSGWQEERIIAIKIMEKKGKDDPARVLQLFRQFSTDIDNWGVCDGLGMQFLRGVVRTHADEIFAIANKLSKSRNPWQRRLSLVMVEWYTRSGQHHAEIKKLVTQLKDDEEYYVKKAVTWINRNFKKGK
jgi:3-methyladenine DNA glycosylase AlkD